MEASSWQWPSSQKTRQSKTLTEHAPKQSTSHSQIASEADFDTQTEQAPQQTVSPSLLPLDSDSDHAQKQAESPSQYPPETTHIFQYNTLVDEHNKNMLSSLPNRSYTFTACDAKKDSQTGRLRETKLKPMAGGLLKEVHVAVGAKVILKRNVDVSDGLVNTAAGTVKGFIPEPDGSPDYKPK